MIRISKVIHNEKLRKYRIEYTNEEGKWEMPVRKMDAENLMKLAVLKLEKQGDEIVYWLNNG